MLTGTKNNTGTHRDGFDVNVSLRLTTIAQRKHSSREALILRTLLLTLTTRQRRAYRHCHSQQSFTKCRQRSTPIGLIDLQSIGFFYHLAFRGPHIVRPCRVAFAANAMPLRRSASLLSGLISRASPSITIIHFGCVSCCRPPSAKKCYRKMYRALPRDEDAMPDKKARTSTRCVRVCLALGAF